MRIYYSRNSGEKNTELLTGGDGKCGCFNPWLEVEGNSGRLGNICLSKCSLVDGSCCRAPEFDLMKKKLECA